MLNQYRYKQLAFQEWADLYDEGKLNETQASFYKPRKPEQLFDVENDPYETKNLAEDPEFHSILLNLRGRLNSYMKDMPDLSFYPEHYLIANAFENPEKFGQTHKDAISKYIDIADLSLSAFKKAKNKIKKALTSNDPWERYWAVIVCSTIGKESIEFASLIKEIAISDKERINKIRALEYMGLVLNENPLEKMTAILIESKDKAESLLILNTMVLMTDGAFKYRATFNFDKIPEEIKKAAPLKNRYEYLTKISN